MGDPYNYRWTQRLSTLERISTANGSASAKPTARQAAN